ncbi:MAG: site-2 protease family protein [Deltaproteobacteria bacterium]|nr:site-2 protease family protein [Deltaproteobacteria bacterium]
MKTDVQSAARRGRRSIKLFKVRGIQINLDFSWFIVFALVLWSLSAGYLPHVFPGSSRPIYWTAGLFATLLFFFSIIAHELCHSMMALRLGIKIPEINLFIFGGVARLSEEAANPKDEFKIAAVGPLSSFALAAVFWGIRNVVEAGPAIIVEVFGYLAWANFALAVFNLIPGFPLDGGRIFRALWWWKSGSMARATKIASDIGKGFAIALMVLGGLQMLSGAVIGGVWLIFIGMFLKGMAEVSYQEIAIRQSLEGMRVRDIMIKDVVTAPSDLPLKRLISDYFLRYGFRGFPVTDDGRVLGLVSLGNIKDLSEEEQRTKTVGQAMTPVTPELIIPPETQVTEALKQMAQENTGRLLVMDKDRMIGMITQTGLLRLLEMKRALET